MSHSTVNVASNTGERQPAELCRWEIPEANLSVEMRLDLVEKLGMELIQALRSVTRRGSEIGGLLLGRVSEGAKPVVSIEDYQTVACEYKRGPLYLLTESDRRRLQETLRACANDNERGLTVVGYFRSNTRKDLLLDEEDQAIMAEFFPESHNVLLLVKPAPGQGHLAGLYVRKGESLSREPSLTFPFSGAPLVKTGVVGRAPVRPPAASVAPVSETRQARCETAGAVRPLAGGSRSEPTETNAARSVLADTKAPGAPVLLETATDCAPPPSDPQKTTLQPPATSGFRRGLLGRPVAWAGLSAIPMVIIGLLAWLQSHDQARAAAQPPVSLGLSVERSGEDMLLSWNRSLPLIAGADRAIISIKDGERYENLELDPGQLRSGRMLYSPITSDVSFRLEVTDLKSGRSAREWLRVFGWRTKGSAASEMRGAYSFPAEVAPTDPEQPEPGGKLGPQAHGRRASARPTS